MPGADRCEECGFVWSTPVLGLIQMVSRFPDRVYELTDGMDHVVYRRPAADVWSPSEYVWHAADVFSVFGEWLHTTRTQDQPTCATVDGDALAEVRRYAERPLPTGIWSLWNAVAAFVHEAVTIDPERQVRCEGWGEVSAAEVIALAAHEAAHHTMDLERVLLPHAASEVR